MPTSTSVATDACQVRCIHPDAVQTARAFLLEEATYVALAQLFGALADSTRAKIVHLLLHQELCTCDLSAALEVTDSCVSQHLRILRTLRLVKSRRLGKFVYHSLDDHHISMVVQIGLAHLGHEIVSGGEVDGDVARVAP